MYNVKGPSKIVAKTRRGLVKNIENSRDQSKTKKSSNENMNVSKPVFQNSPKKIYYNNNNNNNIEDQVITPEQEELIKFVHDSWNFITSDLDSSSSDGCASPVSDHSCASVVYYEDEPVTALENFKPFDLETWWGKRLFAYITNTVNSTNNLS